MGAGGRSDSGQTVNIQNPFASAGDNVAYRFGPIDGLSGDYASGSVNELLGKLASAGPGKTQIVYGYLTGSNQFPDMATMLDQIGRSFTKAGGAKATLKDLYAPGTYVPKLDSGSNANQNYMVSDGGLATMRASQEQSAYGTVTSYLNAWNLMNLAPMAMQLITDPGNHLNADEVMQQIRNSPEYNARFPGLNDMRKSGRIISEQDYSNYENDIVQQGQFYGLPQGFLTPDRMGEMIKNGIYGSNLKARLDAGYAAAMTAPAETRNLLKEYFGVDTGHLAAYYIDPSHTSEILTKNWQAAQIGGAAIKSGWGDPGKGIATELAAQAKDSQLSVDYFRQGFGKAASLRPLETAQIGQRGEATASAKDILASTFTGLNQPLGTTPIEAQTALQQATEARTAGLRGGGGFAQSAKGAVGVGRAGTSGIGQA